MTAAMGLLAMALLGGSPPERDQITTIKVVALDWVPGRPGGPMSIEREQVGYEVRIIETRADDWRRDLYRSCTRVGREGRSTVWTIEDAKVKTLLNIVCARTESNVVQAPNPTAFADDRIFVDMKKTRSFVVDLDRVPNSPGDSVRVIAFRPIVEKIQEGVSLTLQGHRAGQGIHTHLKLDSTWVGHVATSGTTESIKNPTQGPSSLTGQIQLPQVVETKLDGDYDIPDGRMLLVSLGTSTTVDTWNRPVVMERLALIKARTIVLPKEEVKIAPSKADAGVVRTAFEAVPRPMPPLPSRSLLPAIGPDGKVVAEPAVVDDAVKPVSLNGPPVPLPSPQSKITVAIGMFDPSVAQAGTLKVKGEAPEPESARVHTVWIPLDGRLAIVLKASIVPKPKPD